MNWTTSREEGAVQYGIEKSKDGRNFTLLTTINGYNNNSEVNYYTWVEPSVLNQTAFYRIRLIASTRQKFSRIIRLSASEKPIEISIPNPFTDKLITEINTPEPQLIRLNLIDNSGRLVRSQQFALVNGNNQLQINTANLPRGLYTLQMQSAMNTIISKKLLKQ